MKKWKVMIKILVVLLFIFAGTSVTTAEEGVTDKSVKIGSHMDLSGVIAYFVHCCGIVDSSVQDGVSDVL